MSIVWNLGINISAWEWRMLTGITLSKDFMYVHSVYLFNCLSNPETYGKNVLNVKMFHFCLQSLFETFFSFCGKHLSRYTWEISRNACVVLCNVVIAVMCCVNENGQMVFCKVIQYQIWNSGQRFLSCFICVDGLSEHNRRSVGFVNMAYEVYR
jgi:hypothetical protein